MTSFTARPFPPPTLAEVPIEYVIEQLRNLAPYYWERPETADCTIIVPIPHIRQTPTASSSTPSKFRHSIDFHPSALGSTVTESSLNNTPRLTFKLHMDYLSAHSSYLRALFSGACAMDLINSKPSQSPADPASQFSVPPPNRLPKLLSSANGHSTLYFPVPDPSSFHLLIHWMYFNEINLISDALHDGSIQWEGIARNVEYLGLSADIKLFLTRWYHTWLDPIETMDEDDFDSDSDSDTDYSDSGDGEDSSCTTPVDMDMTPSECMEAGDEKEQRGRPRLVRPLSFQSTSSRTPST